MLILGLAISSSITGFSVLDENMNVLDIGHISLAKYSDMWEKVDEVKSVLETLYNKHSIDKTYIEESLMRFSPGFSSANTIINLAKFNALISYISKDLSEKNPIHISAATARKTNTIKLLQKKLCGKSHKEQSFEWAVTGPLKNRTFETGKTGK